MKRALSILLCLTLLFGVSGFPAASADNLNVDYYYELPESITVDGVTITADGQLVVTDEKLLQVLGDIDSAAYWTSLTIDNAALNVGGDVEGNINASGRSVVDIEGHVDGYLQAGGAQVTIGDGIELRDSDHDSAISAMYNAIVKVCGDVINDRREDTNSSNTFTCGVGVSSGAEVHVDGNISAFNRDGTYGTAILAANNPYLTHVDKGGHVEVTGNVQGRISAYGGSTVDILGSADGWVSIFGKDTKVSISKDLKGDITATDSSTVDVQGHVEGHVQASGEGTHVKIADGVSPKLSDSMPSSAVLVAIDAYGGADVDVIGDVDGAIWTWGSSVDVSGNAKEISIGTFSSNLSSATNLGSTVRVGGDVANGVYITMYGDGTDQNKLTVEGTINSMRDAITLNVHPHVVMDIPLPTYPWQGDYSDDEAYQKAMEEYQQAEAEYIARQRELRQQAVEQMNTGEGVQKIIDNLPQIIVGTLAPEADFVLVNGGLNRDNQKKITEALLSQINYIVNMEGVDTANIAVYGYEELDGYLVAREQQKLTVKCINDNMIIANVSAGRYATIDANDDGSYTITVQRGGDLNLVVTARPKALPVSMNSGGGTENGGTNSAYDEAQWSGWLSNLTADYAMRTLTLDLTGVLTTDIPYETLRAYLADYGIDTLIVITGNAEYTMSIAEVLALAEEGSAFTFTVRDGALEIAVNGSVVSTFSVK